MSNSTLSPFTSTSTSSPPSSPHSSPPSSPRFSENDTVDCSLAHYGVKLLLTNQFTAAKQLFEEKYSVDPTIALLHSFLSYGNAISSYSESDLKACIDSCKRTESIGEKLEKQGKKEDSGKRIEGILIQADCALLTACIHLVEETYVKMMWNMRKSYNLYQDVQKMVDKYKGKGKDELLGWVKYGVGLFNLLLSQLPPSVLSFAEMVGYEGDRDKGLKLLTECQMGPSFNAPFAALLMLVYYLTIAPLTGDTVEGGMEHSKKLIEWGYENFPDGAFFALMESKYYRSINETRKAIEIADKARKLVGEMPSIEIMFHFQKAWCAFVLLSWQESAEEFDKLLHSTLNGGYVRQLFTFSFSPPGSPKNVSKPPQEQKEPTQASAQGSYAYQVGLCYAMLDDWHKAGWYMESVPVWLKKAGGAPKEIDLYAKRKASEFLDRKTKRKEDVLLDVMDLLNVWNEFSQMPKEALDQAEQDLNKALTEAKSGQLKWEIEEVIRCELALACISSTRGDYKAAHDRLAPLAHKEKPFIKSSRSKKIGLNSLFYYELANVCFYLGDISAAKEWHKKAAKATGYDLFKTIQTRLHTLKLKIKEADQKQKK